MNSVPVAFSWECWSRGKTIPLLAMGICTAVVWLFYASYLRIVTPISADDLAGFHAALFGTLLPILVVYATVLVGVPELRFTLPVSTWTLVGWPMLNGCLATAGGYLLLAIFANILFAAQWPLVKPLLAASAIYALSQAASWIPECGRLRPLISVVISASLGVAAIGVHTYSFTNELPPYWQTLNWSDVPLALGLILGAYATTVAGVNRSRRGQPLSLTKIAVFLVERLDFHMHPRAAFASSIHAQGWYEWVSKGIAMPAVAIFWTICMCAMFSTGWLGPAQTVELIFGLTYMALILTPLLGWFLGSAGPRFNISEFTATRPLTDTQLADRTLVNAARSVLWGWTIWWIGAGLALGCAWLSGSAPTTPSELIPIKVPPVTWLQAALYTLALVVIVPDRGLDFD